MSYPLDKPYYKRYEYKMDNNNNWVSKTEFTRSFYSKDWKLESITLREIQYNDGTRTGSANFTSAIISNAKSRKNSLGTPTRDPEGKGTSSGTSTNNTANTVSQPKSTPQTNTNTSASTGCTYGDCNNGWGRWNYDNGYYSGFWSNGKRHGYGLYDWKDAGKYIGFWENDQRNGYGVYFYKNDKDELQGMFINGELNGTGKTYIDGKWSQGIYKDGILQTAYTFYTNKDVTTGCVAGDCQNKYGRYKWSNGDQFTGFFKNGRMFLGTYSFANGDKYSGEFNSQNQFHGDGRFFFKSGEYYGGKWSNGKYNGRGYYIDQDKKSQIGRWSNGSLVEEM